MQATSAGDKGIKGVAIVTLLLMGLLLQNKNYMPWLLLIIGPAYIYFAILKYKAEKIAGLCTEKARNIIVAGGILIAMGIGMLIFGING